MKIDFIQILKENGLSPKEILALAQSFKTVEIAKNKYFVRYEDRMNKIGILLEGIMISRFTAESSGKEIVSKFYYPNGDFIVVDFNSFKDKKCSTEEIQAISNSKLMILSFDKYHDLIQKYPSIQKMVKDFAEQSYLKALNRIKDFQSLSKVELIRNFTENHKEILNQIQVQDKASYLGMSRNVFTNNLKKI